MGKRKQQQQQIRETMRKFCHWMIMIMTMVKDQYRNDSLVVEDHHNEPSQEIVFPLLFKGDYLKERNQEKVYLSAIIVKMLVVNAVRMITMMTTMMTTTTTTTK